MSTVIDVQNLSKRYQIGVIGYSHFYQEMERFWALKLGKEDLNAPLSLAAQPDDTAINALDNVCFKIEQGDRLGVMGRNGAGKSTLFKILSRITAPSSGEVKIKGRVTPLLDIGAGFHTDLTGLDNIYLKGALLGMHKQDIDRSLEAIIEFSECRKFIHTPVKRYSSGMFLRLAFSIMAHCPCEIMLIDEVLAVGDIYFQEKCLAKMRALNQNGTTILLISHNLDLMTRFCSKGLVLDQGKLTCCGNMVKALEHYQTIGEQ